MLFPVVTIIMCVLLGICYTLVVHKHAKKEVWPWWHTFVSLVLSFVIGTSAAVLIYDVQQRTAEDEQKERFKSLSAAAFTEILESLQICSHTIIFGPNQSKDSVNVTYVQGVVLEEAARSGLFDSEITKVLLQICTHIGVYNLRTQQILSLMSQGLYTDNDRKQLQNSIMQLNLVSNRIQSEITTLFKEMHLIPKYTGNWIDTLSIDSLK